MTSGLGAKPKIDTTEFQNGIRKMNSELRVLESGFKAAAATMTDWTKDATGLEKRSESLTKQIEIQKQKVAATREEWERSKKVQGENSLAANKVEADLNKETETLNKMQKELGQTETSLQDLTQQQKSAANASDDLGDAADKMGDDLEKSEKQTRNLGDTLKDFGKNVAKGVIIGIAAIGTAAIAAVAALGKLASATYGAASDLNESISKTEVVFGSASGAVLRFSETSASALGLSQNAALTAAGTYGNLLRAMGLTESESADMSISLVKLASDLASFNNQSPEEVLDKLRAGLTGEAEPLKSLGVNLNQARIESKALELGLAKQGEELSAAAKAQAAYAIILEDTALAQGDFGRTSEGQANQQRIFAANIENLRAKIGTAFLPVINLATKAINDLVGSPEFGSFVEKVIAWFADLAKSVEPVVTAFSVLIRKLLGGEGLFAVMDDGSSVLGGFFERLGMGQDEAYNLAEQIGTVAQSIGDFVGRVVGFLQEHGETILKVFASIAAGLGAFSVISTVVGWITGLIATVTSLAGVFTAAGGGIAGIVAILGGPVTLVIAAVAAAIALLTAAWQNNWFGIRDTVIQVWENNLKPALQTMWEWLSVNIPLALQALGGFWTGTLLPAIQRVWSFLSTNLFPVLKLIGEFIGVAFQVYIQSLATAWQTILLPALQLVWNFLSTNVFPLLQAIGRFISAVFSVALRAMAGLWQNVLLPALRKVYDYLNVNIMPIFKKFGDFLSKTFQPILDKLSAFLRNSLAPAFNGISSAISNIIGWLTTMADKLDNLQLPAWLTPGSPTPWEIGLIGINDAMRELNKQLPTLAGNLNMQVAASVPGIPSRSAQPNQNVQNDDFRFYGPVIVQGSTPAGSLGARLKGRRY